MGQGSCGAQLVPLALKPSCGCCQAVSWGLWSHLKAWLGENKLLNSFTLLLEELSSLWANFPGRSVVKHLPASAGDIGHVGLILGSGRSRVMDGNHSSILAWRIPWTEELGRLQSIGSKRVGHAWAVGLRTLVPGWLLAGAAPQFFAMWVFCYGSLYNRAVGFCLSEQARQRKSPQDRNH